MSTMNAQIEKIITFWILDNIHAAPGGVFDFQNAYLEQQLPQYGKTNFDVLHSPGIYGRAFRRMRNNLPIVSFELDPVVFGTAPGLLVIHVIPSRRTSRVNMYKAFVRRSP